MTEPVKAKLGTKTIITLVTTIVTSLAGVATLYVQTLETRAQAELVRAQAEAAETVAQTAKAGADDAEHKAETAYGLVRPELIRLEARVAELEAELGLDDGTMEEPVEYEEEEPTVAAEPVRLVREPVRARKPTRSNGVKLPVKLPKRKVR